MSKRLGGIIGCKYKTSSWHSNGFHDGYEVTSELPGRPDNNSAELESRQKFERRESGRDGKILRDHRQDGNVEVDGIGNPARC